MCSFIRSSGFIISTPLFNSQIFPISFKIILSLIVAFSISMNCIVPSHFDVFSLQGLFIVFKEMLVGCLFGFCVQIVFQFMIMAGNIISMQSGLSFATMNDPQSGINFPIISQFLIILSNLILISNEGDLYLINIIKNSYHLFPLDKFVSNEVFNYLPQLGSMIFLISLKLSMPIVVFLLIINLSFGIISKISSNLNIISYSFPISMVVGIAILTVLIPDISYIFIDELSTMFHLMSGKAL